MGLEIFERGQLPRWAPVRQFLDSTEIGDVRAAIAEQFRRSGIGDRLRPGQRVALTAGSRGIDRIDEVIALSPTRSAPWAPSRSSCRRWGATAGPRRRGSAS